MGHLILLKLKVATSRLATTIYTRLLHYGPIFIYIRLLWAMAIWYWQGDTTTCFPSLWIKKLHPWPSPGTAYCRSIHFCSVVSQSHIKKLLWPRQG